MFYINWFHMFSSLFPPKKKKKKKGLLHQNILWSQHLDEDFVPIFYCPLDWAGASSPGEGDTPTLNLSVVGLLFTIGRALESPS